MTVASPSTISSSTRSLRIAWAKKGASTAFTLLALLASQPGNFATKDWLSEKLGHLPKDEEEEDLEDLEGLKRVDNVVSLLRHLLYPARSHESSDEKLMRRSLVAYQRASSESGPGYRLAGAPLLWLDVEEIREHVKRARRLEQFGEDGLAEWRAAYDLAMQGRFLPQEAYCDWAAWRHHDIETHLWDCVQTLWHRYVEQGEAGETEALCVLRAYWQSHVTNEDALRPLLELLGKHENFGQAEDCYNQLCEALVTEGKQPDQRTRETMDFLRAMQIQRAPKAIGLTSSYPLSPTLLLADQAAEMVGCDPLDDPYTRLTVTGTLSGLHLGGYHLVKAGILNTAGLSDQAMIELHQLKRLTEQTYGQDETRNLAWSNITTAEALLGLKEYEEAEVKAKDALIACYHIHSIQNAMMITDIYCRITAGFHGTVAEVLASVVNSPKTPE
jgi:hypothetical protein